MIVPLATLLFTVHFRDRATFDAAYARVGDGMSPAQVESILGPPDDVWTASDLTRSVGKGQRIWCYGTNGHLTTPTLGRIAFYHGAASVRHYDGSIPNLPPERILGFCLQALDDAPYSSGEFNALGTIRAINALRPLGKAGAIAAMIQYDRIMQSDTNATVMLDRLAGVLFLNDSKVHRRSAMKGLPYRAWPSYPLLVVDDVPLLITRPVMGGYLGPFEVHAKMYGVHWTVRGRPLLPPDDPFPSVRAAFERTERAEKNGSAPWGDNQSRQVILDALATLLREVGPPRPGVYLADDGFETWHRSFLSRKVRWSSSKNRYFTQDSATSPYWKVARPPEEFSSGKALKNTSSRPRRSSTRTLRTKTRTRTRTKATNP